MIYDVTLADGTQIQVEADGWRIDEEWVHFSNAGEKEGDWEWVASHRALSFAPGDAAEAEQAQEPASE